MTPVIRPLERKDMLDVAAVVASAFADRKGIVPDRYQPIPIIQRLQWSLNGAGEPGVPRYLVAEVDGEVVGVGGYAVARFGGATWELLLAATKPELQGRGIGHQLLLARWDAIRAESPDEGGVVVVSTKNAPRFLRYGFHQGPRNPVTGAYLMWAMVPAKAGRQAA